jgi:hypothetical protein
MIVRPAPETCAWLVPSALAAAGPDTEAISAKASSAPKSLNFDNTPVVLLQKPSRQRLDQLVVQPLRFTLRAGCCG